MVRHAMGGDSRNFSGSELRRIPPVLKITLTRR
jgi:hypothetical protein